MMNITIKLTGLGLLFLLIIISGIWLTKTGRPYQNIVFNVHKLISLLTVVLGAIMVYNLQKGLEISGLATNLMILAGIMFIILIITGGLLNLDKPFYDTLRIVHRILSPLSIILTIIVFYILLKK
jgi:hypothetical protein